MTFLRMTQGNLHEPKDYYDKTMDACDKIGNINAKLKVENQLSGVYICCCGGQIGAKVFNFSSCFCGFVFNSIHTCYISKYGIM